MSVGDWLEQTRTRYREQPARDATMRSVWELWHGAVRRGLDPRVGTVWWERDWDVLVVLDGCRVDLACETLPVDVGSTWSPASASTDWLERHFAPEYRDEWTTAAYVTANPLADHDTPDMRSADLGDRDLGLFDPVYNRAWQHEPISTTPPGAVTDAALAASDAAERVIVHYMQPHQPFRSRPDWESVYSNLDDVTTAVNQGGSNVWKCCRDGEIDPDELWAAYRDTLQWVWDEVRSRLLPGLPAESTVVVTSDHGNGMGEWGVWGHPSGTVAPAVRRVPYVRIDGTGPQTPVSREGKPVAEEPDDLEGQLAALGYV